MSVPRILILSDSPVVAETLCWRVTELFPDASCQSVATVGAAAGLLAQRAVNVFVVQLEMAEGDGLDLLRRHRSCGMRTLVLSGRAQARVALSLRALGVEAVHDFHREPPAILNGALDALISGRRYWSSSFDECLLGEEVRKIRHQLTPREQLAFALLATGLCEKALADQLGLTLSSARSLGRDLHAKLGLRDRRDVQQAGARLGYTRFGADGLSPFGLSILIEEYRAQSRRPAPLPAALLAACGLAREDDLGAIAYASWGGITRMLALI